MATRPTRILLVDDDEAFLHLMKEILSSEGYEVLAMLNSRDALEADAAADRAPDLLITDIILSGTERGYELAWQLTSRHPGLPVLMISGHAQTRDEIQSAIPGSRAGFVEKPFRPDALLSAVEQILAPEPSEDGSGRG